MEVKSCVFGESTQERDIGSPPYTIVGSCYQYFMFPYQVPFLTGVVVDAPAIV